MARIPQKPQTEGSSTFDPERFFEAWEKGDLKAPQDNAFRKFIIEGFGLRPTDNYIYRAIAEVTLPQTQAYLERGGAGRLHEWYRDEHGSQKPAPPPADIEAYNSIFSSTTSTPKALNALAANAKKESLRAAIAAHLQSLYQPPSSTSANSGKQQLVVPRLKTPHTNPYLDVWAWSNLQLEWAGPDADTSQTRISHALLPVLYHHFGCIVPSFDALCYISQVARGRTVVDLGSGNGYWTFMLRQFKMPGTAKTGVDVVPVDSGLSEWRTMWVGDTVVADGIKWLAQREGGKELVLLLVYPQVGADFTANVLRAYKGDTIIVAGTQNANGFTAFAKEAIGDWMAREMPHFDKVLQVPLPSFAGKDEALFIFQVKPSSV